MKPIKLFDDFLNMHASVHHMSREQFTATYLSEDVVNEKVSFAQMKKNSKTKEYKEVSNAIDGAQEVSDIWNMLDPKMFKFTEDEFEDIFHDWWNTQSYDSLGDFSRNGSFEDAHSLYLHLLPYLIESTISEKREDVGKYNTVKKVIAKLGRRPSEQDLASFINNNYYDVTEVERGDDDPSANDKIADLVAFYKFDIDDWEIAWFDAQNESVVTEAKPAGLSKKETLKVAQKFADALTKLDGMKYTVSSDYEEDSFDLDIEDQDDVDPRITGEYAGGSYNINADGSVVNMAVWNKKNSSPVYGNMDDDIKTIIKTIKNIKESVVTESVAKNTKIYQIATPAPKAMLVEELEDLFGDDYRHIVTEFDDDEGYESVLVFNLTKNDIKRIQEEIGDVLIWEYSIKKGKAIS